MVLFSVLFNQKCLSRALPRPTRVHFVLVVVLAEVLLFEPHFVCDVTVTTIYLYYYRCYYLNNNINTQTHIVLSVWVTSWSVGWLTTSATAVWKTHATLRIFDSIYFIVVQSISSNITYYNLVKIAVSCIQRLRLILLLREISLFSYLYPFGEKRIICFLKVYLNLVHGQFKASVCIYKMTNISLY